MTARAATRHALLDLYEALAGASWAVNEGWLSEDDVCQWRSSALVSCDGRNSTRGDAELCCKHSELLSLFLYDNCLEGTLPTTLGLLTGLERLALNANRISGSMPTQIGLLTRLTTLALGEASLSGRLPPMLGQLTALHSGGCFLAPGNQWRCPMPDLPAACSPSLLTCTATLPLLPPTPQRVPVMARALPPPSLPVSIAPPASLAVQDQPSLPPPSSVGPISALLLGASFGVAGVCAAACVLASLLLVLRRRLVRHFLYGARLETGATAGHPVHHCCTSAAAPGGDSGRSGEWSKGIVPTGMSRPTPEQAPTPSGASLSLPAKDLETRPDNEMASDAGPESASATFPDHPQEVRSCATS